MTDERALVPVESEGISAAAVMERVVISGDLSRLTPVERVAYYARTCESLGLNPLTRPFDYISLSGKLTLYARKDATDQIRRNLGVAIVGLTYPTMPEGLFGVVATARLGSREDTASGIVPVRGLQGENLANAMMKAETKAKRRVTLSIAGLGVIDESEVASIPDGQLVEVDDHGNIKEAPSGLSDVIAARLAAITEPEPETAEVLVEAPIHAGERLTETTAEPEDVSKHVEPEPVEPEPVVEMALVHAILSDSSMSMDQFIVFAAGFNRDEVRATAKEMYPEAKGFKALSEQQLGTVAAMLTMRHPVVVADEIEEPELLAEAMDAETSAAMPATCGEESPFSPARCVKDIDHSGPHTASLSNATETW